MFINRSTKAIINKTVFCRCKIVRKFKTKKGVEIFLVLISAFRRK